MKQKQPDLCKGHNRVSFVSETGPANVTIGTMSSQVIWTDKMSQVKLRFVKALSVYCYEVAPYDPFIASDPAQNKNKSFSFSLVDY